MSCVGFCVVLDDVRVQQVKRAIMHKAQRGIGHEEDALYLGEIEGFSELEEHYNV